MDIKQDFYAIDFAETKVIWFMDSAFIVPENLTFQQEVYIKAALRTLHFGNVSVDNILKNPFFLNNIKIMERNREAYEESIVRKYDDLRKSVFKFQKEVYFKYKNQLAQIDFYNKSEAYSHCGIIYKKLDSSFSAIRMLLQNDYIYESYALLRQLFEQIAFAYDTQFRERVKDFKDPTWCVTKLKEFYPSAGRMYGELSTKTHIDSSQFRNHYWVEIGNEENAAVQIRSRELTMPIYHRFLLVLDLYCCVFEHIFYRELNEFEFIKKDKTLRKNRITKKFATMFATEYERLVVEQYGI